MEHRPEAAARAGQFGPNKLAATRAEPRWRAFIRQYYDPMQIVLLAAGVISLYPLKQFGAGPLLILLTLVNAVLGLQQEGKAETAVAALQDMMIVTARARRDGQRAEIPAEHHPLFRQGGARSAPGPGGPCAPAN